MKKSILLLIAPMLFGILNITALKASDMKCGGGKCASSMKAPVMEKPACCEHKMDKMKKPACCEVKKSSNSTMKCGAGKCDKSMDNSKKQAPKETMKCGSGKCS